MMCENKESLDITPNCFLTMSRFIFLLMYLHSFADCSCSANYRFGIFEDHKKTTELTKEELFNASKLRRLQKLIHMKGR